MAAGSAAAYHGCFFQMGRTLMASQAGAVEPSSLEFGLSTFVFIKKRKNFLRILKINAFIKNS